MLIFVMALILFLLAPGGFIWLRDASMGSNSLRDGDAMIAAACACAGLRTCGTARVCYCVANMQVYAVVMTQRKTRIYSQTVESATNLEDLCSLLCVSG